MAAAAATTTVEMPSRLKFIDTAGLLSMSDDQFTRTMGRAFIYIKVRIDRQVVSKKPIIPTSM